MILTHTLTLAAVLSACLVASAQEIPKIYLNPSDQTGNWSPDRTYNEAEAMQDVARRLEGKLNARGFGVRNSNGATMRESCEAANAWPADIFISLHTNARGGEGWGTPRGTLTLYYQPREGEPSPISIELAQRCMDKCVEKYITHGVGHPFGVRADLPFLNFNLYVLRRTNMPGTLVEGLFHDNEADTAVLKTEEGRDAYAQGVYEAVCDHFGWSYYPDAPILDPAGPVANDSTGNLALVDRGAKGDVRVIRQTGINGAWPDTWTDLGGLIEGEPVIARNPQDRLQAFARGRDGRIRHKVQSSAGSDRWNGWYDLGGSAGSDPVVGIDDERRLIVFAVGLDGHLRYRMQRSVRSALQWEDWSDLGGKVVGRLSVCADADGRLTVACRAPGHGLIVASQSGDDWVVSNDQDDLVASDPVLARDREGRVIIFCLGSGGRVLAKNGGVWDDLGGSFASGPVAVTGTDGRVELFAVDSGGAVSHSSEDSDGNWTDWRSLGGVFAGGLAAGRNLDGRIVIFARRADGGVQYRVQREPGKSAIWDGWYPLGETPDTSSNTQ